MTGVPCDHAERDDFHAVDKRLNLGRRIGLHRAHHHILAAFPTAAAFIEHPEALADPGRIAQEHLELAATLVFVFLGEALEKLLGGRTLLE